MRTARRVPPPTSPPTRKKPHDGIARHTGLHLFEDTVMVEVVDDGHRPLPDGQMGTRWLLISLYNRTQPLIRYEVTDMLCRSEETCPCGRRFSFGPGNRWSCGGHSAAAKERRAWRNGGHADSRLPRGRELSRSAGGANPSGAPEAQVYQTLASRIRDADVRSSRRRWPPSDDHVVVILSVVVSPHA